MDWLFFGVLIVIVLAVVWYYRVYLRGQTEKLIGWARNKGTLPLVTLIFCLSLIPVFPQNVLTLTAATMRLRVGVPVSFCALLVRVWVCCMLAPYLFAPMEVAPILKSWWAGYIALQFTPTIGASAAGLKTIGYATAHIVLLTIPVAMVNTTLLVVCPNGIWHLFARCKSAV